MTATMSSLSSVSEPSPSVAVALAPLMVAVLVGFLVIGAALPVLPFFVRDSLGFGTAMVGVVAGCQFAAALIARIWAGQAADTKGAKWAVMVGLAGATLAGLLYLASYSLLGLPRLSIGVLLAGRGVLGAAESFIITGATTWGLARVGAHNAGKVIAWMGTAMFAAFAAGAPLGTLLYERSGFGAVSAAAALAPLLTLLLILPLRAAIPAHKGGPGILSVVKRIWLPGFGAALGSVGFGAIAAFSSLLFADHGWTPVWLAFSAYAVALIVARLAFGHLPDRIGGARVVVAVLRGRGDWLGADVVCFDGLDGGDRRGADGLRLFARLSRARRRGCSSRSRRKAWRRHGRLYGLPRYRARRFESGVGPYGEPHGIERRVFRQRPGRAQRGSRFL